MQEDKDDELEDEEDIGSPVDKQSEEEDDDDEEEVEEEEEEEEVDDDGDKDNKNSQTESEANEEDKSSEEDESDDQKLPAIGIKSPTTSPARKKLKGQQSQQVQIQEQAAAKFLRRPVKAPPLPMGLVRKTRSKGRASLDGSTIDTGKKK